MPIHIGKEILIFFLIFVLATLLVTWILNGGAYAKQIRYSLFLSSPLASSDLKQGELLNFPEKKEAPAFIISEGQTFLNIPKISVTAPIIVPESGTMRDMLVSMEEGVGLYPGSALPGDMGRSVVLGHSSRASWYRGEYATVFALLNKLESGDTFTITRGTQVFSYQVFAKKILTPKATDALLSGSHEESEIDLITCYPVGSASQRTVIQAKLVN